jgi:hypothetical protein
LQRETRLWSRLPRLFLHIFTITITITILMVHSQLHTIDRRLFPRLGETQILSFNLILDSNNYLPGGVSAHDEVISFEDIFESEHGVDDRMDNFRV